MDECCHDQDDPPQDVEVSSTSVEHSHAVTSSIEESHASKPQDQSMLMNYPSKDFIHVDSTEGSGTIFLPAIMSKSISCLENLEKIDSPRTTSRC